LDDHSWLALVAACRGGGGSAEEFADLGPGEVLVAGVVDGLGQELLSLGGEAGQGVQVDGRVAEPVGGAQPGKLVDRIVEDLQAVVAGGRCGQLAGAGQAQYGWVMRPPGRVGRAARRTVARGGLGVWRWRRRAGLAR
jgi:hypothetical protein